MKTLELSTASKPLAEYADELDGDIIVVVSNNTPVAALVDDPEYIVRLIKQVVTVSGETVKIMKGVPELGEKIST